MKLLVLFLFPVLLFLNQPSLVFQEEDQKPEEESKAAPAPLEFDENVIASLKEQPAFDYTEKLKPENFWTKFKRYLRLKWNNFLNWLFQDYEAGPVLTFIFKILPYLLLFGIFLFSVWLFNKIYTPRYAPSKPEIGSAFFSEDEEIVQSKDIQKLIRNAISNNNFRLAVRYYYLFTLQQLSKHGIIEYEFSKTGQDYLSEVKQEHLQKQFGQLTHIYNFVWYGSFSPGSAYFEKAQQQFRKMEELIGAQK